MRRERPFDAGDHETPPAGGALSRRSFLAAGTAAAATAALPRAAFAAQDYRDFRQVPTQYIAALSGPDARSGNDAQTWGLWRQDPGPRGVPLQDYDGLLAAGGVAPAKWRLDDEAWWLEEHGLIMERPEFPLPAGRYLVTGGRAVTTVLTVAPMGRDGGQRWALDGATVYDVTHLRCRSALYTPVTSGGSCSPAKAQIGAFPVQPGAAMPPVAGCHKQDYAVLIVIAVAASKA
ncbi:MAG TPA: hypothetical protein VMU03_15115 [Gammaproteobacteria bacterium]|nr:hypothetical protein [Gammaproteobacteria bacterium]